MVDGDGLRGEGRCAVLEGGGEGDGLIDGGGGVGRGEGERGRHLGDVHVHRGARGVAVRGVAVVGGAVVVGVRCRLVVTELVVARRIRHVRCHVRPRGVVCGTLQGNGPVTYPKGAGAQGAVDGEVLLHQCRCWRGDGERGLQVGGVGDVHGDSAARRCLDVGDFHGDGAARRG